MNWSDERYVRLYTRKTVTWRMLPWQGKALLPLLMQELDRAGVLDLQSNEAEEAVAAVVELPLEHVIVGLEALLSRGIFELTPTALVMPKFMEAQSAAQSDKQRQTESRARRRDLARLDEVGRGGTGRDDPSQKQTELSRDVTERHEPSRDVTLSCAVPSLALKPPPTPSAESPALELVPAATEKPEVEQPSAADDFSPGGLFAWMRGAMADVHPGSLTQRRPKGFDSWAESALAEVGPGPLSAAYLAYLRDDHWRGKGWPLAVFMSEAVWRHRVPIEPAPKRRRL